MMGRTRPGAWSVAQTAARLANIHAALTCSVRCLGGWLAAVPELEAKITRAYHLYDLAELADRIEGRIEALTAGEGPLPSPANRSLGRFFQEFAALSTPAEQNAGLYRVLLPELMQSCREQMERTNPVADEPTVRLLYQIAQTAEDLIVWAKYQPADPAAISRLQQELTFAGGLHGPGANPEGDSGFQPALVEQPAREPFLTAQAVTAPGGARAEEQVEEQLRYLHDRLINREVPAMEALGRALAQFPDAPRGLRLELARMVWDQARHAVMCADRLRELGGELGCTPYHHEYWQSATAGGRLAERLGAIQTAEEIAGEDERSDLFAGDPATGQILAFMAADRAHHHRIIARWLQRLEGPR